MQEQIRDIRKRLRLAMNGVISTSMREKGMNYKLIFGVIYLFDIRQDRSGLPAADSLARHGQLFCKFRLSHPGVFSLLSDFFTKVFHVRKAPFLFSGFSLSARWFDNKNLVCSFWYAVRTIALNHIGLGQQKQSVFFTVFDLLGQPADMLGISAVDEIVQQDILGTGPCKS